MVSLKEGILIVGFFQMLALTINYLLFIYIHCYLKELTKQVFESKPMFKRQKSYNIGITCCIHLLLIVLLIADGIMIYYAW